MVYNTLPVGKSSFATLDSGSEPCDPVISMNHIQVSCGHMQCHPQRASTSAFLSKIPCYKAVIGPRGISFIYILLLLLDRRERTAVLSLPQNRAFLSLSSFVDQTLVGFQVGRMDRDEASGLEWNRYYSMQEGLGFSPCR